MKKILLFLIALFQVMFSGIHADEYLHPSGQDIVSAYSISDSVISFGDDIFIIRTITNNEFFNITGLFFSDHIPTDFHVTNQTADIDGTPITFIFSGAQENLIYPGYRTYHWTLDSPVEGEPVNNILHPGETLTISYKATSTDIGNYVFPLHTVSFAALGEGYFITSDSLEARVVISLGIDDNTDADNILPHYIRSIAYPNPFNAEVRVLYEGNGIEGQQMEFQIYNILGQQVHEETVARSSNNGEFYWQTHEDDGSGVYFYKIKTDKASTNGKLVLVK